jgi:hypothetical protein
LIVFSSFGASAATKKVYRGDFLLGMLRQMVGVIASQEAGIGILAKMATAAIQRGFMVISTFISCSSTAKARPLSVQRRASCPESIGLIVCRCLRRESSTPAAAIFRIGEAHLRPTNDALDFLRTPALLKRQIKTRARASGSHGTSVAAASFRTARLEAQEASTKP